MNHSIKEHPSKCTAPLAEYEEKLLVRYFDGEHSFIDGLRVKRLLKANAEAESFLGTMKTIGEIARNEHAGILAEDPNPVNLWDRISARIESEERAAVFHGGKVLGGKLELGRGTVSESERGSIIERLQALVGVSWDNVAWGTSGALAAAVVTLMIIGNGGTAAPAAVMALNSGASDIQNISTTPRTVGRNVRTVSSVKKHQGNDVLRQLAETEFGQDVRLNGPSLNGPGQETVAANNVAPIEVREEDSAPTAVEVNWMRSSGRVRMMQDPSDSSAIIWVRRGPQVQVAQKGLGDLIPSYVSDKSEVKASGMNEPLVVFEDRTPRSIPVGSFGR